MVGWVFLQKVVRNIVLESTRFFVVREYKGGCERTWELQRKSEYEENGGEV